MSLGRDSIQRALSPVTYSYHAATKQVLHHTLKVIAPCGYRWPSRKRRARIVGGTDPCFPVDRGMSVPGKVAEVLSGGIRTRTLRWQLYSRRRHKEPLQGYLAS